MAAHRFRKGDPAINRKGRPKDAPQKVELKELAAAHTTKAIAGILAIAQDAKAPKQVRLAAWVELLDRAHGRPKQAVDVIGEAGLPVPVIIVQMAHPTVAKQLALIDAAKPLPEG